MGTSFCLLFLIKIFNMAAEPYRGVLGLSSLNNEMLWTLTWCYRRQHVQSAKLCQASIQCQRAQPIYRVKPYLRKSLTSDAPIGNAATPTFLSSCETRYISAGGVQRLLRKSTTKSCRVCGINDLRKWRSALTRNRRRYLQNRCRAVWLTTVTTTTKPQLLESIVAVFRVAWRRESMWLSSSVDSCYCGARQIKSGARQAQASLIDGECRVNERTQCIFTCGLVVTLLSRVVRGVHSVWRGYQQAGKRYGTNGADERAISILAQSHDTRAGQI